MAIMLLEVSKLTPSNANSKRKQFYVLFSSTDWQYPPLQYNNKNNTAPPSMIKKIKTPPIIKRNKNPPTQQEKPEFVIT